MSSRERGRLRAVALYLGLASDEPKPTPRQALVAFLQVLPVVLIAALVATVLERRGAPEWLTLIIVISPIWVLVGLLGHRRRRR